MKKILLIFLILFLILFALFTFFSPALYKDMYEERMHTEIREALDSYGYENVQVDFDHHHATASGQVGSNEDREEVHKIITRVWGAYAITDDLRGEPLLPPTFYANRLEEGVLKLAGQVPNEETKTRLVGAAEKVEGIVRIDHDQLKIAEVGTPAWTEAAELYLPSLLGRSGDAALALTPEGVTVSGTVADQDIHDALADAARAIPGSDTSFTERLELAAKTPAQFDLKRSGKDILLTGVLPDEATQQALVAATKAGDPEANVVDKTTVDASVAAPLWAAALPAAATKLVASADEEVISAGENGVRLAGIVPNDAAKTELAGLMGDVPLTDDLEILPWTNPVWKVTGSPEKILVTGVLPDAPTQKSLLKAVKSTAGDVEVIDSTEIRERVHPIWWGDHSTRLLPQLTKESPQTYYAEYGADRLIVRGESADDAKRTSFAAGVVGSLPEDIEPTVDMVIANADPVPLTPSEFRVVRNPEKIIVTGLLPNKEEQAALLAEVKKSAGKTPVEDKTKVAKNVAPIWWKQHFATLVPQLAKESVGGYEAHYTTNRVFARSEVANDQVKAGLTKLTASVPDQIEAKPEITVVPPAAPVAPEFVEQLALLPVYFGTNSDAINADEDEKINKAARIIKNSAGDLALTVGGYADLRGSAEYNKALSLRRANAVKDRLIKLGVPASKLEVNHFGEDTSEVAKADLWKSRRVVISLTELN